MSEIKGSFDVLVHHFLSSARHAFSEDKPVEFRPRINQEADVTYDVFGIEVPEEKLRHYLEYGFLEIIDEVSMPICPICGDTRFHPLLLCPKCGSMNIEKKELMAHYECGYLSSVDDFETVSEGIYRCPKCGKTMSRVGIEYGWPGFGFVCKKCGSVFRAPLIEVECRKGHRSKAQTLDVKKYPVYRISPESKRLVEIYYVIEDVRNRLSSLGIKSEFFARVQGISGVIHIIPLYVISKPIIAVDIIPPGFLEERYLLRAVIKAMDLSKVITVLVLPKKIEPHFEEILDLDKVRVIKIDDLSNSGDRIIDEIMAIIKCDG